MESGKKALSKTWNYKMEPTSVSNFTDFSRINELKMEHPIRPGISTFKKFDVQLSIGHQDHMI